MESKRYNNHVQMPGSVLILTFDNGNNDFLSLSPYTASQIGSLTSLASSSAPGSQSGSMIDLSSYGEGRQAKKLIRRDHLTALQRISEIEGAIEQINHFIESTKYGPDHQRYALLKEKEKLILELQRFELYVRTEEERVCCLYN